MQYQIKYKYHMENRLENIKDEAIKILEPYSTIISAVVMPDIEGIQLMVEPKPEVPFDTFDNFKEMIKQSEIVVTQYYIMRQIMLMIWIKH